MQWLRTVVSSGSGPSLQFRWGFSFLFHSRENPVILSRKRNLRKLWRRLVDHILSDLSKTKETRQRSTVWRAELQLTTISILISWLFYYSPEIKTRRWVVQWLKHKASVSSSETLLEIWKVDRKQDVTGHKMKTEECGWDRRKWRDWSPALITAVLVRDIWRKRTKTQEEAETQPACCWRLEWV